MNSSAYMKPTLAVLGACVTLLMMQSSFAMQSLSDEELSDKTGRESGFLTMETIGTSEHGNPNPNVGFTRLNLNAKLELNSNMNEMRLGCDNPDYTDCDISLDKVVFTGIVPAKRVDGQPNNYPFNGTIEQKLDYLHDQTGDGDGSNKNSQFYQPQNTGPGTDFVMDKPFLELAVQNPGSLVDRKVVGFRFGAHEVWGIMSVGEVENDELNPPANPKPLAPPSPEIFGPPNWASRDIDPSQYQSYGRGQDAINNLWAAICRGNNCDSQFALWEIGYPDQQDRFQRFQEYINYSIEKVHSGVNTISGRLPARLDNLNIAANIYRARPLSGAIGVLNAHAHTAVAAGNLSRTDAGDFGRIENGGNNNAGPYESGYLRNVFAGDTDTYYNKNTWGEYLANDNNDRQGRAPVFKRGTRAVLDNMIVNVHGTILNLGSGDRFNKQDIAGSAFHQLQFGSGENYEPGKGSKHFAFQFQTLDGLQWITTDQRASSSYDINGNPTGEARGPYDGYDWLSTRAGWWLESPLATVKDAYIPYGQATNYNIPEPNEKINLLSLDVGARPIDNCYGNLTFC